MTTDEEFGNELLSNLIKQAETLQSSISKLPKDVPYPSRARPQLISFLEQINAAIIQRLHELRTGPPKPSYTTIETPAKRLGQVLTQLFELLEFIVHSEAHRIPAPLIPPFEAMVRKYFSDALLLVRYIWQYNFINYVDIGDVLKSLSYSGLNLPTPPPEHFIVIGFPTTERENVLLHCAFAHELGHFLTQEKQLDRGIPVNFDPALYQALLSQNKAQLLLDVTYRWYLEVLSDVFGIYLLGPASFLAFSEISLQMLHTPSFSHPPPHLRLTWMLKLLRRLSYLDQKDQSGNVTSPGRLDPQSKAHFEKWDVFLSTNPLPRLDPLYECVMKCVLQAMDDIQRAVEAVIANNGYTAQQFETEVGPLVERILRLVPPSEGDSVPNPSFESIMNTGWVVRTTRLSDLHDVLSASEQDEQANVYKTLNALLYKAVEYLIIKKVWEKPA